MNLDPLPRPSRSLLAHVPRKLWFTSPLLVLSATSASAQDPCPPAFQGGNFVCSPAGVSNSYRRLVGGDLNSDWDLDVATIKGGTVFIYHGPGVYNQAVTAGTGALDLCFASDSDGQGTPGILFTTASGLSRVKFNSSTYSYDSAPADQSNLWKGATLVRSTVPILGTPSTDSLIGVKYDQHTVIRSIKQAGGFASPTVLFDVGFAVLDIVPLNWDSDIQTELAILQDHGVQVRELDGTVRMTRAGVIAGDAIAAVRAPGSTDSLAWVTRLSGWSKLMLFNQGFTTQGPSAIATRIYNSMASADLDADGDDDLVLASSSVNGLTVLKNVQGTTWFPTTAPESVDMTLDNTSEPSSGQVLCANLFNEWTGADSSLPVPGFALVLTNQDGLRLRPGSVSGLPWVPPSQFPPTQAPGVADISGGPNYESGRHREDCDVYEGTLSLWKLWLGDGWGLNNATHVQMVVRKSQNETPEDPAFTWEEFQATGPYGNPVQGTLVQFDGAETVEEESMIRYFVQVRPVRKNGNTVVRAWRWSLSGMSASCAGTYGLKNLPGAQYNASFAIHFDTCDYQPPVGGCSPPPPEYGANFVPSAVPLSQIPGGPGTLPTYPPN